MLRSKFVKFLLPVLKRQVSSSPNFVSLFSFMKDSFYILFSSKNIYFTQKEPIKVNVFETFECSGQNLSNSFCQFWNDKSVPLQILYLSLVSWKIASIYFLAQRIYTLLKRSPLKWKFLRLLSVQVKICQIPFTSFEMATRFLSKFCIPIQFDER